MQIPIARGIRVMLSPYQNPCEYWCLNGMLSFFGIALQSCFMCKSPPTFQNSMCSCMVATWKGQWSFMLGFQLFERTRLICFLNSRLLSARMQCTHRWPTPTPTAKSFQVSTFGKFEILESPKIIEPNIKPVYITQVHPVSIAWTFACPAVSNTFASLSVEYVQSIWQRPLRQ